MSKQLKESCKICGSKENLLFGRCEDTDINLDTICETCHMILSHSLSDPEWIARIASLAQLMAKGQIRTKPINPNSEDTWYEIIDVEAEAGRPPVL